MAKARTAKPNAAPSVDKAEDAAKFDFSDVLDAEALSPQLAALQAELGIEGDGESYKVHISKTIEGKDARVWDGSPDDYDLMHVARQHGSGDYRVKLYGPHSSGRTVIRANTVMTVQLLPEEDLAIVERRTVKQAQHPAMLDPAAIALMVTQSMTAALAPVLSALQQPQRNPLDDLKGLAEVVKAMMPAPAPVAAAAGGFTETLANFRALRELTAPAGDAADPENHAMTKGIDLVAGMLAEHAKGRNAPPQLPPPQNGNVPAQAAPISPEDDEMNLKAKLLAIRVRQMNAKATAKASARDEAEEIYDDLPGDILLTIANDPQWFDLLCELVPECASNKEWFELMRLRLVEMAQEDGVEGILTAPVQTSTTSGINPPPAEPQGANGNSGSIIVDNATGGNKA